MQEIDLKQVTQKERGGLRIRTGFYNFIITPCLRPVVLTWHAGWNVFSIIWIYLAYPFGKETTEYICEGEVKLGR